MKELTQEQLLKMQQNLKVGKCPNCGYTGDKDVSTGEYHLVSLDIDDAKTVGLERMGSLPTVIACCPQCGYISLFNCKFICR